MKRIIIALVMCAVSMGCSKIEDIDVTGEWVDTQTRVSYCFTEDGGYVYNRAVGTDAGYDSPVVRCQVYDGYWAVRGCTAVVVRGSYYVNGHRVTIIHTDDALAYLNVLWRSDEYLCISTAEKQTMYLQKVVE